MRSRPARLRRKQSEDGAELRGCATVKLYSTKAVSQREKAGYWNSLCNKLFDLDMNAVDAGTFEAEAIVDEVGPLLVSQITSGPIIVERTRDHIAHMRSMRYSLLVQTHGQSIVTHHGDEIKLRENDFIIFDNTYPHRLAVEKEMTLTAFSIPEKLLRRHFPDPAGISGICMSGMDGMSMVVSSTLRGVWEQVRRGLDAEFRGAIAENLLDFVAIGYAAENRAAVGGTATVSRRRLQIKKIIEDQLHDPDLSSESIAAELRISPRYLRMVFAAENETVSSYILRRRLEKCARQLLSPVWRGRTITEIALHCGFNNAAHFSRVFRSHYGITPRGYRESAHDPAD